MTGQFFKAVQTDAPGDDWPMADFGLDAGGKRWWLTTHHLHADEIPMEAQDPDLLAALVAANARVERRAA